MFRPIPALLLLLLAWAPAPAQTLSHSVDRFTIVPQFAPFCAYSLQPRNHEEAAYWRTYRLLDFGVTNPATVTSVSFGVDEAVSGSGQGQVMEIRIWRDSNPGTFPSISGLQLLASECFILPDIPTPGRWRQTIGDLPVFQPFDTVVVQLIAPSGAADGNTFRLGSNDGGETAPSWFSSTPCNLVLPAPVTQIGFPIMHAQLDIHVATGDPTVRLSQAFSRGPVVIENDLLLPGNDYYNVFSLEPCPGGPGTGPWLGLCTTNFASTFATIFALPRDVTPFFFRASSDRIVWPGAPGLPRGLQIEIVCLDVTGGRLGGFSPVFSYTVF